MLGRPYQDKAITDLREALKDHNRVCLQLPTGGGKTWIFSKITQLAAAKGNSVWIVVPRNELLEQASATLVNFNVPHGTIRAGEQPSNAYMTHIASKDTLIRRINANRIKRYPSIMIIDECHVAMSQQEIMFEAAPSDTLGIGVTATPERLDGRGLNCVYDKLVLGADIKTLIAQDYLTPIKYFAPRIDGLEKISVKGTEYDDKELDAFLSKRTIYGDAARHYKEYADGKTCLVFCRSIKAAEQVADKFSHAGYKFAAIHSKIVKGERKKLFDGLRSGIITGLVSCELTTYGLDVPRVECIIMLRPTLSRTLYCQMIGRGLRPCAGKEYCIVLDHVGNLDTHGHPLADYTWRFEGMEKTTRRKFKDKSAATLNLCTKCFFYFEGDTCPECGGDKPRKRKDMRITDDRLVEVPSHEIKNVSPEYRRQYQEAINWSLKQYGTGNYKDAIAHLINIADKLNYRPMWVYHEIQKRNPSRATDVPLLYEIARQKRYKPGWVYHARQELNKTI